MIDNEQKVNSHHLARNAYLYVRQSTVRQVIENTESTRRQYELQQRAIDLGWPRAQIVVIDTDLGKSGASAADREGFQKLVTEVGMGRAGIVMGLEVSRLARNSTDWHRLIEICAFSDTLILDEDGVYNPAQFNDRLLLGLKGTMSEAELHMIRTRLRGGILNKARRGELEVPLPIGFLYGLDGKVILDPDKRIQETIRNFFATYRRIGSAIGTVQTFNDQGFEFPTRPKGNPPKEAFWKPLTLCRALSILHNPRYAGAFAFGRTNRCKKGVDGKILYRKVPRDEWFTLLPGTHSGYITWEEFEENQRRLLDNCTHPTDYRRGGPPREGAALLQGLVICGICGYRMTVRYHINNGRCFPRYVCQRRSPDKCKSLCQHVPGWAIDEAVSELLLELMQPITFEIALAVQQELEARAAEADALHAKALEQARYESELARRRFMQVDPDNRLVADALEDAWNEKLKAFEQARNEYERQREQSMIALSDEQAAAVRALAQDFPSVWRKPATPHRERKRLLRLLIEDVTLVKSDKIHVHVRLKGGQTRTLTLPLPVPIWVIQQTSPEVVAEIDRLLDDHTDQEVVDILNKRGFQSGTNLPISLAIFRRIRDNYGLVSRYERMRARGLLTVKEIADHLGVSRSTVLVWRKDGLLKAHRVDEKRILFEHPGEDPPVKYQGLKKGYATSADRTSASNAQGGVV